MFTIISHFSECATLLRFWAIFTNAPHFYHFAPFLRVRHIFTILRHFYECTTFLPSWAIILVGHIFTIFIIFTIAPVLYQFEPFLRVRLIFTISSHFYGCAPFLPFCAIFTSTPQPILRDFTNLNHFNKCATFLLLAIFISVPPFYHFEIFWREYNIFTILSILRVRYIFITCHFY